MESRLRDSSINLPRIMNDLFQQDVQAFCDAESI